VVGAGIKPSSLIAAPKLKPRVQKLWLDWTDEADAEGFTDFYANLKPPSLTVAPVMDSSAAFPDSLTGDWPSHGADAYLW
jgi:hypothetical protein